MDINKVIDYLLPNIVIAGDYAAQIQAVVQNKSNKNEKTVFQQALTDADLSVQNFLEVALLARYPGISFYSEEEDKSLNMKYFPSNAKYEISLDPINGTQFYRDNLRIFDIIITVTRHDNVVSAVTYLPCKEVFYFSITNAGAFTLTKTEVLAQSSWRPFRLSSDNETVMVFDDPETKKKIETELTAIDLCSDYDPKNWSLTQNSILTGELGAYVRFNAHLIDWGAIGFIVGEAGGVVTDALGNDIPSFRKHPNRRVPSVVVAANHELHEKILRALGN